MPRITIKDLHVCVDLLKRENRTLKRKLKTERAEHDKYRVHDGAVIMQIREALRNEQDNVQSLRRLMNESRSRLPVTRDYFSDPPPHPIVAARKPTIATHLL